MESNGENFNLVSKLIINEETDSISYLKPAKIDGEIDISYANFNINYFNSSTRNPEEFALELFNHVKSIGNERLSGIFTKDFLFNVVEANWWILPNLSLEDYKIMSYENFTLGQINQYIDENIITDISELNNGWSSYDVNIQGYLDDAINYYNIGKYGICALLLLLVLNMRLDIREFDRNTNNIKVRLENMEKEDSFDIFKIKSFQSFIDWIIKPLSIDNAFNGKKDKSILDSADKQKNCYKNDFCY